MCCNSFNQNYWNWKQKQVMKAEYSLGNGETCLKNKNVNSILTVDFKIKLNYQFRIKLNCCTVEAIENFECGPVLSNAHKLCHPVLYSWGFWPLRDYFRRNKMCPVLFAVLHKPLGAWDIQAIWSSHLHKVRKGILKERTSLSKVFVTFTSNVSQNLEKNINQTLSSHRHLGLWFG